MQLNHAIPDVKGSTNYYLLLLDFCSCQMIVKEGIGQTDEKNGGKISKGSYDDIECEFKSRFRQKITLFNCFHTIFDEEFKTHGLESLRHRYENLLRKLSKREIA